MKQKCEEIIIEQYLKGNITYKEKNRHLAGLVLVKENQDFLKQLHDQLTNNPPAFFKTVQENHQYYDKQCEQFIDDNDLSHLSKDEQKRVFIEKVLIPMFMEEIEDELSE